MATSFKPPKQVQNTQLSFYLARKWLASVCIRYGQGVQIGSLLRLTRLQIPENEQFFRRSAVSCANSSNNVYLTPAYDGACNLANSGASCGVSGLHLNVWERLLVQILIPIARGHRLQLSLIGFKRETRVSHIYIYMGMSIRTLT